MERASSVVSTSQSTGQRTPTDQRVTIGCTWRGLQWRATGWYTSGSSWERDKAQADSEEGIESHTLLVVQAESMGLHVAQAEATWPQRGTGGGDLVVHGEGDEAARGGTAT